MSHRRESYDPLSFLSWPHLKSLSSPGRNESPVFLIALIFILRLEPHSGGLHKTRAFISGEGAHLFFNNLCYCWIYGDIRNLVSWPPGPMPLSTQALPIRGLPRLTLWYFWEALGVEPPLLSLTFSVAGLPGGCHPATSTQPPSGVFTSPPRLCKDQRLWSLTS